MNGTGTGTGRAHQYCEDESSTEWPDGIPHQKDGPRCCPDVRQLSSGGICQQTGGLHLDLCLLTNKIFLWTETHYINSSVRYILRKQNVTVNQLSHHDQVIPIELSLLQRVLEETCRVCRRPKVNLFANRENKQLSIVSPAPDPVV